jgi:hypothetical protein
VKLSVYTSLRHVWRVVVQLHSLTSELKGRERKKNQYILSKGKAITLQALTGPEGSRKLRLPDF